MLFGDLNEVQRFGSSFSSEDAGIFNSFIHKVGLIDLPMGGRMFTLMNKAGTKLSKIDHFLISRSVIEAHSDIHVTILDKMWLDYNLILLHCKKIDFGPIPFKIFHSWLEHNDFGCVVKEAWENVSIGEDGSFKSLHENLKGLKYHLRQWYSQVKVSEGCRKKEILTSLKTMEKKMIR